MASKPARSDRETGKVSERPPHTDRDYADAETKAVRASPVFRRLLAQGRRDAAEGKVYPADDVMAEASAHPGPPAARAAGR